MLHLAVTAERGVAQSGSAPALGSETRALHFGSCQFLRGRIHQRCGGPTRAFAPFLGPTLPTFLHTQQRWHEAPAHAPLGWTRGIATSAGFWSLF